MIEGARRLTRRRPPPRAHLSRSAVSLRMGDLEAGSAGSGAGMSHPGATGGGTTGGFPAGSGAPIPATTPPIGIAVGIDVGITSVDVGGTVALEWLLGALYAKKADLKQLRAAARQTGIKDEEDIREFGDWLEWDEKRNERRGGKDHYSFKELVKLAQEWLALYR